MHLKTLFADHAVAISLQTAEFQRFFVGEQENTDQLQESHSRVATYSGYGWALKKGR
jgi:hypothetical protein